MKLGILCDAKDALTLVGRLANTIRRLTAERATTINDSKNLLILNRNSNCVSISFKLYSICWHFISNQHCALHNLTFAFVVVHIAEQFAFVAL